MLNPSMRVVLASILLLVAALPVLLAGEGAAPQQRPLSWSGGGRGYGGAPEQHRVAQPRSGEGIFSSLSGPEDTVLSLTITLRHGPPVSQTPEETAEAGAPADTVFRQGEPIDVAFTITNEGEKSFRYIDVEGSRPGGMGQYRLVVTDERGRRLADPWKVWGGGGRSGGLNLADISPGESFTKHVYLNQWVMPLSPGHYTVVGVYWPHPHGARWGYAAVPHCLPVEMDVRPRTEADLKAYVRRLGGELQSDEPQRRLQAVRYLGFSGSLHALSDIARTLYDEGQNVAFRAGEAFRYMTDRNACIRVLLRTLDERGPITRLQYLVAHYKVPKSRTLAPTIKGLSDPDATRRAAAARTLGQYYDMGDAALVPLLGTLKDKDPGVRQAAVSALWNYRLPKATAALLAASYDPDEQIRRLVIQTLGILKAEAAIPRLSELLVETPMIACAAVDALRKIGTAEAVEALRDGLEVVEETVRVRTAAALLSLGDDSVRALLADALESASFPWLASDICNLLGNAVEKRGIPGPGPEGKTHMIDPEAWLKWLRQSPRDLTTP